MKALIDPDSPIVYIVQWNKIRDKYYPVEETIPNSARVCQIEPDNKTFGVAEPLFWEDCTDTIIPDVYYFDLQTGEYLLTPVSPPQPVSDQPVSNGTQTL